MKTNNSTLWPIIYNNTGHNKSIFVTVLRTWNGTTFEQKLLWPKDKTIASVIFNYQHSYLGDDGNYQVIDFYISEDN